MALSHHMTAGSELCDMKLRTRSVGQVGSKLRGLGTSVFTGTRELLEQVTDAISSELDSIEGMAARNRPGAANRSSARRAPTPDPNFPFLGL